MTPDASANMPPIIPEASMAELANLIRKYGVALVESKLSDELFGSDWQVVAPNNNDNSFADRGAIGFEYPESKTKIPYSPEPLAASVQYLDSYSSMKTKGKNQLIMSAPVGADHPYNHNILHRFEEPFREIVISLELPQEGFTTRRSLPNTTTPARFKFFLPDQKAQSLLANLKDSPESIRLLLHELWPGTQKVTLNSTDIKFFELTENPNNQAKAAEIFARMNKGQK